jgi:uncharacterized protein involved in exopolysaccharide biosynthesis
MHAARSSSHIVQTVRRHGRAIVLAGLAVSVVGSAVSILRPKEYAAVAHVRLTAGGGLAGPEFLRRANAAGERLLGHDAFAASAGRLGVDAATASVPQAERMERRESLLAEMRAKTTYTVEVPDAEGATAVITCRDRDPDDALRVVAALAQHAPTVRFDDEAVAAEAVVETAGKTVAEAQAVFDKAAAERAAYREANAEFLGGVAGKLQATRRQRAELREVTIVDLEQQRKHLDDLLGQEKQYVEAKVRQPDPVKLAGVDDRIAAANERLRQLTEDEKKPVTDVEVVQQKEQIAALNDERKKLVDEAPEVVTRQESEQWTELTRARGDVQSRLDAAQRQLKLLAATEKDQEELSRRTPEVEAKDAVLASAESAAKEVLDARSAEMRTAQEKLDSIRVLGTLGVHAAEDPQRPEAPTGPSPVVLAFGGLAAGLAAGFARALSRERADRSFRTAEAVSAVVGVPMLGAVDVIRTPPEEAARRSRERRGRVAFMFAVVGAAAVFAAAIAGGAGVVALVGWATG